MDAERKKGGLLSLKIKIQIYFTTHTHRTDWSSPVVVEPGTVAGNDDVVGLLADVVLAGVHQSIDLSFALLFVILQARTGRAESAGRRRGAASRKARGTRALTFPDSTESSSMSSETQQREFGIKTPTDPLGETQKSGTHTQLSHIPSFHWRVLALSL